MRSATPTPPAASPQTKYRRRIAIALIGALIFHALLAPFLHWPRSTSQPHTTATAIRLIALRPVPKHRHHPRVHHHLRRRIVIVRVHQIVRLAARPAGARAQGVVRPHHVHRRALAPRHVTLRHELAPRTAPPVAMASEIPSALPVAANGTSGAAAAGAKIAGSGALGSADAGSGNALVGSGNGDGRIPCGQLDLVKTSTHIVKGQLREGGPADQVIRTEQTIQATIHFADGSKESDRFPYPFVYAPGEPDPFLRQNRSDSTMLTLVQFPPADFDRSTLSPVIRDILKHTSSEGISLSLPCDQTPPH